ncbi:uncharacterized protein LOC122047226 [Zingiber officinale]|uniref:uncharacterized protein LOC122042709 n=1 Tax=Zingiber officinale TaxID=94328 RepID=UPI001C4A7AD4|nr:uncharacterized protein LOC122042709 [Zingiber officinale]XP_042458926.1 uncharacterized protein LOC122042710 [Zingiber officinale]XP_042464306.1 uncharacterized protein LOC122047226 [Zingiber officinale]
MAASVSAATTSSFDDPGDWVHKALVNPHLPAEVLLSFRRRRPELEAEADEDADPSTSEAEKVLEWGKRIKRSRVMRLPRIAEAPLEEEPAVMKRRPSPQSPLDLCRSASASSNEKPEVVSRSPSLATAEACRIEVVAAPSIPASARIRRPAARKMTKLELQAVERTLLEERAKLRKEIEDARRTADELRAHNHKLKQLRAELPKIAVPSSPPPRHKASVSLPDLNVPLPDCYSPS